MTAATISLGGGRVNANSVTIASTGNTTVGGSTTFSVRCCRNVKCKFNFTAYAAKDGGTTAIEAGTMNIAASGVVSSSGVLSRNGDAITIDVDGTLTHNGQIKSNGIGQVILCAANVTITATTIAGTGSFNLSGANGANGARNSDTEKMVEMEPIY